MWSGGDSLVRIMFYKINKIKIMRTFRKLLVPVIATLAVCVVSCTNDYEMWDEANETVTWEFELRNIMSDLDFLFENSFVKFQQAEELNYKVDSLDFFSDDTYYPVCVKKLYNFFMLKKLDFVANDTNTIHMPSFAIKRIVSNIVNNQEKYNIVKLTWSYGDEKFTTLAVFDKTNGQLIYDNILTNIPLSQTEIPSKRSKLTRTEPGGGDTRIFFKDTKTVTNSLDDYILKIKALCTVKTHYHPQYGWVTYRIFKTVNYKFIQPTNPYQPCNSKGEAAKVGDLIIGYIWIGSEICPFNSSTQDNCSNAYNVAMNNYPITGEGQVWSQPVSAIIDIADLEENPTEGEWAFN